VGAVVGFIVAGPEGAAAGATWGYAIGDSVGVAIERSGSGSPSGSASVAESGPPPTAGPGELIHVPTGQAITPDETIRIAQVQGLERIPANTDGQRYLTVDGESIRVKAAKAGHAVFADVYSRPLDNPASKATGWPRHMFIVYDNGTKLWELENRNGRISFPKRSPREVRGYFENWQGQLRGPLTVTVDRAQFDDALAAQETRAGQPYRADYENSNYAVRWVIQHSITYGIGPVPKESLGGPRGAPGGLDDLLSGSLQ